MQLWECYHVTNPEVMALLSHACLDQLTARSAKEMVVFVTRQDLYGQHAEAVRRFEEENTRRHSPEEKQAKRLKKWNLYYGRVRSEEHTSNSSHANISYAVFCLKKNNTNTPHSR